MTPGQIAYEGYCSQSRGYSLISHAKLPPWDKLSREIQAAWAEAAQAVIKHYDSTRTD